MVFSMYIHIDQEIILSSVEKTVNQLKFTWIRCQHGVNMFICMLPLRRIVFQTYSAASQLATTNRLSDWKR